MISEQANANKDTAQYQQQLNMVGSQGPTGSVKYTRDPSQPGGYTQVTELSPEQQALYKLGVDAQTGAVGIANDQLGRISTALGQGLNAPQLQTSVGPTDFTADREAITDAVWNRAKSRLDPNWQSAEDRNRTRLSNQGLSQNSTAYRGAMDDFGRSRNDAYDQALSSAILAGSDQQNTLFNQAMAQGNFGNAARQQGFQNDALARSQPINDFQALLGMGQIQMPGSYQGPTTGVAPTDVMGAYGLAEQSKNNAYQAQVGNVNSKNAALGGLLGATIMGNPFGIFGG